VIENGKIVLKFQITREPKTMFAETKRENFEIKKEDETRRLVE
jgi:hypothetical protein